MRIYEMLEGLRPKSKKVSLPESPKDHVILNYGFALEPFLYSREAALSKAGPRDVVLSIDDALEKFGRDQYLGPDLHKLNFLVRNNR